VPIDANDRQQTRQMIATNAPTTKRQLGRLAKRATLGLARTGVTAAHGSGDIAVIFGTRPANRVPLHLAGPTRMVEAIAEDGPLISALFTAVIKATEEAILNTLFAGRTVTERDNRRVPGLPIARAVALLHAAGGN